jgi:antitoxin ParD1/3/4
MPTTNVKRDPEAAAFVDERVAAGNYARADEAVAAALKLLKENREEIEEIRALLIEAEESGYVEDFDFDEFLREPRAEYGAKCQE